MKLTPSNTSIIKRLLVGRNNRPLRSILTKLEIADIASLFGHFNLRESSKLLEALFSINKASQALLEVPEQRLEVLLKSFDYAMLQKLIVYSNEEEGAYYLSLIRSAGREDTCEKLLSELDKPKKNKIIQFLSYPENSAGRLMNSSQVFCLPTNLTVKEGLNQLRQRAQKESIYYIYSVDPAEEGDNTTDQSAHSLGRLAGIISLRQLAIAPLDELIENLIKRDVVTVRPEQSSEEIAKTVSHYEFIAIPVVDENRNLLGIITIDDVLEIIQEQATADIYARAGLQEDDRVYTSVSSKIKNRMPWMILNLFLAAVASSVVSLFEDTMSELIILASLKNIVAGMGGNTAIQSLTVVTRGLATGDFKFTTYLKSVIKEISAGLTIGIITGIMAGFLTYFWKGDPMVSIVICISMIINSLFSSFMGAVTPMVLTKIGKDPALGSGVIVTMATDIFSFLSFLGIATLGLKYIA